MRSDNPHSKAIVTKIEDALNFARTDEVGVAGAVLVDWVIVACWVNPVTGEYEYRRLMLPGQPPHRVEGLLRKGLETDWEEMDAEG